MFYVLQYPNFTTLDLAERMCDIDGCISKSQVFNWLMFGKLPEPLDIAPSYSQQLYEADERNRYISNVTVEAIPVTNTTVNLAVGATMVINNPAITSAVSNDVSVATASIVDSVLTITGVAAGTATITVKDPAVDNMMVITVTVA